MVSILKEFLGRTVQGVEGGEKAFSYRMKPEEDVWA